MAARPCRIGLEGIDSKYRGFVDLGNKKYLVILEQRDYPLGSDDELLVPENFQVYKLTDKRRTRNPIGIPIDDVDTTDWVKSSFLAKREEVFE
ncbi:MAG: hypothetical protein ABIF08_00310 [Nanoarchaeota archaeon]